MPSQLDLAIDATINRLMADDGPLTVTYVEKFGVQLPMLAKAPGNMADYLAFFCATHADKEFLVDGNIISNIVAAIAPVAGEPGVEPPP